MYSKAFSLQCLDQPHMWEMVNSALDMVSLGSSLLAVFLERAMLCHQGITIRWIEPKRVRRKLMENWITDCQLFPHNRIVY